MTHEDSVLLYCSVDLFDQQQGPSGSLRVDIADLQQSLMDQ